MDTVGDMEVAWSTAIPGGTVISDPVLSVHGVHVHVSRPSEDGEDNIYTFGPNGEKRWSAVSGDLWRAGSITVTDGKLAISAFDHDGGQTRMQLWDPVGGDPLGAVRPGRVESARGNRAVLWSPYLLAPPRDFFALADDINQVGERPGGDLYTRWSSTRPSMTLGESRVYHAGDGLAGAGLNVGTTNAVRVFPWTGGTTGCGPFTDPGYACPTWVTPVDGSSATVPVLGTGEATLYVGTGAGTMYALSGESGTVQWSTPVGSAVLDPPALAEGTLFVPTQSGEIVALDAATGTELWRADTGSPIVEQPAVADGVVFTASSAGFDPSNGSLRAFDGTTGSLLWQEELGSRITGAPAISGGALRGYPGRPPAGLPPGHLII